MPGNPINNIIAKLHNVTSAQELAIERSLGIDDNLRRNAAEWMRLYFRHARTLNRQLLRYVDQRPPVTLSLPRRLMNAAMGPKTDIPTGRPFAVRDGLLEAANGAG